MNLKRRLERMGGAAIAFVERHSVLLLSGAILFYVAFFSSLTILKHHTFRTYAYDLGIYMQSLWTTIHGYGLFYTSLWEGSGFLAHFEPVLFGVLPLYALFPRAETLLMLQSVVLGLGAIPVYLLARQRLGAVVGLGFAGLYLMYPALHGLNGFDFHATAFAVPILLTAHYFLGSGRLRLGVLFALIALTCRENAALVVFFMGAYWAWRWRRPNMFSLQRTTLPEDRRFLVAIGLCLVAVTWLILAINVAIPHFARADAPSLFVRYSGGLPTLWADPYRKLLYLVQVFGPLGFLPLLAPGPLLIGVPIFAQNLLSGLPYMYLITQQSSALLIPWMFIAAIEGVALLTPSAAVRAANLRYRLLAMLLAVALVFALLYYTNSSEPVGQRIPVADDHDRVVEEVIDLIPDDSSVFTQNDLFPHVCHRPRAEAMLFPYSVDFFEYDILFPWTLVERRNGDFEYVLMDTTLKWSLVPNITPSAWERLRSDYGLYAEGDGVFLYKRGFQGEAIEVSARVE